MKTTRTNNKTKANITIVDGQQTLFTAKARLCARGKKKAIEWEINVTELNALFDVMQQARQQQQDALQQKKTERIEKRANRFIDEIDHFSVIQQSGYLLNHVVLPTVKRWFQQPKPEER